MPKVHANGVELFYDETGDAGAPVVLLIMGLGTQMIAWPEAFVGGLADAGYRVIRFDNRDIGLSTTLDVAYTLTDMAADAVGLLDALGVDKAHVVGASMGGMIAQLVASGWPDRVLTLTSIMSSSGRRGLPGPTPALRKRLMMRRPASPTREEAVAAGVDILALISFPDPARGPDDLRGMAGRAFDRGYNPMGSRRQLLAILADGSRVDRLRTIRAPTLVIHGAEDPLVPAANSEDIAAAVPGARLVIVPGMGHDFPPSKVPEMVNMIAGHLGGR